MVWPQTERKKYWQNLNLAVVPHSVYVIINYMSVAVLLLEVLELSREFADFPKNITCSVIAPS